MKTCGGNNRWADIQGAFFHTWVAQLLVSVAFSLSGIAQTTNYDFNLKVNSPIYTLAVQSDGKILTGATHQPTRLEINGDIDATFNPGLGFPGTCYTIAVQDDGKILLGGTFPSASGQPHTNLARFNQDGSLDNGFSVAADYPFTSSAYVFALAFGAHGSKLIGGSFGRLGGQSCSGLGRLNTNDVSDSTFNPGSGFVFGLAVQADDRILAGGSFSSLAGQSQTNFGRLNADGTLDNTFRPSNIVSEVECFAGLADEKILAGTAVSFPGGQMTNLVRFNSDGTLDTNFNPRASSAVNAIAVQADGKIIVGGLFTSLGGRTRMGLGRLNSDGTLDTNFVPIAYQRVYSLGLQKDGSILIGGQLVDGTGQTNNYIGRLQNTGPATESLAWDGYSITWLRGGTAPEVWRTSFESSINGTDWTLLGYGTRIPGGWRLSGAAVKANSMIRARGRVSAGQFNGTSWFVETIQQISAQPRIVADDNSFGFRTNTFGFNYLGPTNSSVVIEASNDLLNWTPLVTNIVMANPTYFSDPVSGSLSERFYRLQLLP